MRRGRSCYLWFAATGTLLVSPLWARDVAWQPNLTRALTIARQNQKLVMVDVYTDWCTWCKMLEDKTYSDQRVQQVLHKGFVPVKVNPEKDQTFAAKYPVSSYPTVLFLDGAGMVVHRASGFMEVAKFLKLLEEAQGQQRAIQQARDVIKRNPRDADANATLAGFYLNNRATERAAGHIDALCRADPQDAKGRQGSLLIRLGISYGMTGNYQEALAIFERVLRHRAYAGQMQEAVALYYAGMAHLEQDHREEARTYLQRARKHAKAPESLKQRIAQLLNQLNGQPSYQ